MKKLVINENVVAYVSEKTAEEWEAEQKRIAEAEAEERRMCAYYDLHIAHATEEDFRIGYEVYCLGHEMWSGLSDEVKATADGYVFGGEALEAYLAEYVKRNPHITLEAARRGFMASEAYDFYSDWHKDCYGVRPH